ncbi:MAG TPA: MFS transporter [Gammaproteobacteria bacterium]|nr:MFS transporter [Gammaproteobacteria bacterium]
MSLEKMNAIERQSALTLACIMSLRMLGLFMVLPVFSLYARQLTGATPTLIGLSMGIYGLTQALFQIPFGASSDQLGRKRMITLGLLIFTAGSLLCASTPSIWGMIIGRALQGAGAVGSTIIALMADLTRENQRSKAMAIIGMTIGMSFSLAMLLGPLLTPWLQVRGLFGLAGGFSILAIFILYRWVPNPAHPVWHADTEPDRHSFLTVLKLPELARLNIGIFLLHAIFTASFVVLPISLQYHAGLLENHQWRLYLPVLLLAFACSIPCIILAEKKQRLTFFFLGAILMLMVSEVIFWQFADSILFSSLGLFLFFTGFSVLEAFLPSLVSKTAPAHRKGTALGIYSCSQFFGIFVGGSTAGWLYGKIGLTNVYLFCTILAILWATLAFRMKNPQHRQP